MPQSNLISTSLTLDTLRSPRVGFGRMLITDEHSHFAERFRTVSSLTALADLGFTSSDPAYVAFQAAVGQPGRRPSSIDIGRRTAPVAQVETFTVTGTTDGSYSAVIDGVTYSFAASGSTNDQIRDGLISAINVSTHLTAASTGAGTFTVTADVAGVPFVVGDLTAPTPATLTSDDTTPSNGIYDDLTAIRAAGSTGYGIHLADSIDDADEILEAARWAASDQACVIGAQADDVNMLDSVATSDIAYRLKALARQRCMVLYHALNAEHVMAGWLGKQLSTQPGMTNWVWQPVTGFTADSLTNAQVAALRVKYGNWYELMGASNQCFDGRVSDGNYIDTIRGADKLKADIGSDIVDLFTSAEKIPYDEQGLEQVRARIETSIRAQRGFVKQETIQVLAPSFTSAEEEGRSGVLLSDSNIADRTFTGFKWRATLVGAANNVVNEGTLSISDPQ
jgi:Protein of unknown function (DUF3383)